MRAVILAGGPDIGKCPLSMIRPRPLFPLISGVLLEHLLKVLSRSGIEEAVICANGKTYAFREHFRANPAEEQRIGFHDDGLPRGTAGCMKDVADFVGGDTFIVLEGGLFLQGDLTQMMEDHKKNGAALTMGAVPADAWRGGDEWISSDGLISPLGVYVVEPQVLDHVPEKGYFDIKEQLIPKAQKALLRVSTSRFCGRHRRISDASSYVSLVQEILSGAFGKLHFAGLKEIAPDVWVGKGVTISPSAKLVGPVAIGDASIIGKEVVVRGPSLVGENVILDDKAAITGSILWPNAVVGSGAVVEYSIVADSFKVGASGRLSHSVAIDKNLKIGEVHGLQQGGYLVNTLNGFIRRLGGDWLSS